MMAQLEQDFEKQRKATRQRLREGNMAAGIAEAMHTAIQGKQGEDRPTLPTTADQFFDVEEWAAYFAVAYEALFTDAVRAEPLAHIQEQRAGTTGKVQDLVQFFLFAGGRFLTVQCDDRRKNV